jgi:putative ATPase
MTNLFDAGGVTREGPRPLADRLRPQKLADVVGQDHLVGEDGTLTRMLAAGRIPSIILWGPPGTGKTTMARLLAGETGLVFEQMSAIFSGVADLKKAFEQARMRREQGRSTLLFVDEIHRFNKSQQDSFLPFVEDGTITLVGATTENPSFELNGALLSRCQVLVLNRLSEEALRSVDPPRRDVRAPQPAGGCGGPLRPRRHGRWRWPLLPQSGGRGIRQACQKAATALGPRTVGKIVCQAPAALRQGGRWTLQSHFSPAQVGAWV